MAEIKGKKVRETGTPRGGPVHEVLSLETISAMSRRRIHIFQRLDSEKNKSSRQQRPLSAVVEKYEFFGEA